MFFALCAKISAFKPDIEKERIPPFVPLIVFEPKWIFADENRDEKTIILRLSPHSAEAALRRDCAGGDQKRTETV